MYKEQISPLYATHREHILFQVVNTFWRIKMSLKLSIAHKPCFVSKLLELMPDAFLIPKWWNPACHLWSDKIYRHLTACNKNFIQQILRCLFNIRNNSLHKAVGCLYFIYISTSWRDHPRIETIFICSHKWSLYRCLTVY